MGEEIQTDVLVVGAGPVGLALAGDLGWRGKRVMVVDEGDGSIYQPKMDLVGIRTMEFCRRWGIVGDVEAAPYVRSYPQDNVYLTALNGYELGRQPMPSMADDRPPPESPQKRERCPQNMFDPILRRFATSQPTVSLHYGQRLESFETDQRGVAAVVSDLDGGTRTIRASYLVGADGAHSAVRNALGIEMRGRGVLTFTTNAIFRCATFNQLHDKRPGYRYMFVGPNGIWATIVAINGDDLWRMSIIGSLERRALGEDELRDIAYRLVGREFRFEIISVLPWARAELVADDYGAEPVLICGDACHRTSPTGGLGMNTGIGDAVDLSWKLSARLDGWGGPELLESYTTERRPIAQRITQFSTGNLEIMQGARSGPQIFEDSEDGREARERVGKALSDGLQREWLSLNMHLGNRYLESPIIIYEDGEDREAAKAELVDAIDYRPSSRPGARAPHAWLRDGRSTLDLFGRDFTLLSFETGIDVSPLADAAATIGMPLSIVWLDEPDVLRLYRYPLVLVRPDGHVAWRSNEVPADPRSILEIVSGNGLAGAAQPSPSDGVDAHA
ncbi:FAD-dependent monooxygenase [Sphingomonas sp. LB2R24]|uniref:FAD-dependent monooxygenase n=1 Tax=Sphingomonas sorbitolis TaxID=3096165 RepID=UPI002FC82F93